MYNEKWHVYGVKKINFEDSDGNSVSGGHIYYVRDSYDSDESKLWLFGGVCPTKPQWLSIDLMNELLRCLNAYGDVMAIYEPRGKFNRLTGFEVVSGDEEIDLSDM